MDLNRIMLIGNLTRDPETRSTNSGAQVTNFTIAVNERRSSKDKETPPMFIRVETWNKTAELVQQYLKKGAQVLVDGRLKIDEYDTKEGQKRRDPVVVADRVSFGAKPRDEQGGGGYGGGGNYGSGGGSRPAQSRPAERTMEPYDDYADQGPSRGGSGASNTEDDLPF